MKKILLIGIVFLFLVSFVNAEEQSLGTFKKGECINLIQNCANCTYVNFTKVLYPDSTEALGNVESTKVGSIFNYTFCNTSKLGTYIVYGIGDVSGTPTIFAYTFKVNTEGIEEKVYIILIVLIITSYFLIIFGILKQDPIFTMIGSMVLLLTNVYISINGFMEFNNYVVQGFALVNMAIGSYVLLKTGIEWIQYVSGKN